MDESTLTGSIVGLVGQFGRYCYRRAHASLESQGWQISHYRVMRIWRREGLKVRVKRRKKLASYARVRPVTAGRVNERWSMDFVADWLSDGRRIRVLTVIDSFTRECLALKVAKSLPSPSVTKTLNRVIRRRGAPRTIQVDNGSEFTSNHFDAWAYFRGIDVDFIRPGKPVDKAYIEWFKGRLWDKCLNSKWFESFDDARKALQDWRRDYNEVRPHSSLGDMPPTVFAARIQGLQPDPCS